MDSERLEARAGQALDGVVDRLAGGQARAGQAQMCAAVARAVADRRHLLVQAGTGTGKSLAYLVPAVLSGARVVVVTATRALQEQLCGKDLPFLAEQLGVPFRFTQLKGRSNYLCLARRAELDAERAATLDGTVPDAELLDELEAWAADTDTGDRADLPRAVPDALWGRLSLDARECPGRTRCAHGEECFAEAARDRAAASDVVVVNAALYARHLASGGHVLPPHPFVVVDEAHGLEDVAADAFGVELGPGRLAALAGAVRRLLTADDGAADPVRPLDARAEGLERILDAVPDDAPVDLDAAGLREHLVGLAEDLAGLAGAVERVRTELEDAGQVKLRVRRLLDSARDDVRAVLDARADEDAVWVERRGRPVLHVAAVDVGPPLVASLFSCRTAVLTSATLAPAGDFAAIAWRLGLRPELVAAAGPDGPDETSPDGPVEASPGDADATPPDDPVGYAALDVGSPFDYRSQAILYVAAHLPEPRAEAWFEGMLAEAEALVRAAGGRTLGLCTSLRSAAAIRDRLREALDVRVLGPDDYPRSRLMTEFAADETSCLVGSLSLWQGLDVPGPAVSLVLVDKIPFARPTDPLAEARRRQAEREGRPAFATYDLPRAATLLAQGVGRLVRSGDDRGVVAVLDSRLITRSYGRRLLDALPPMYRMTSPDRVVAALGRLAAAREVAGG